MTYRTAKGRFSFQESVEMGCGIEPEAPKSVVEITVLKRLPQIVRFGVAMECRAALSADELEICASGCVLRRIRSVCEAKFLKHSE